MLYKDIDSIKIQNRNHLISKLETGDLIKIRAEVLPIIYHYGIIEKQGDELYIYHNQTNKINPNGGSLVCEPLEKYIKGRDILSVIKTDLSSKDLKEMYEALKTFKYDFIHYNCEHFVNFTTDNKAISNQVFKWGAIFVIGAFAYYLIKNKKI